MTTLDLLLHLCFGKVPEVRGLFLWFVWKRLINIGNWCFLERLLSLRGFCVIPWLIKTIKTNVISPVQLTSAGIWRNFDDAGGQKIGQQVVNVLLTEAFLWGTKLWDFDDSSGQKFKQQVVNVHLRHCGDTRLWLQNGLFQNATTVIREEDGAYSGVRRALVWDTGQARWVAPRLPDGQRWQSREG